MEQKIIIPSGYELKQVSESEYKIVKKELKLPENWQEFCDMYRNTKGEWYISEDSKLHKMTLPKERLSNIDKNFLPNKDYAEAILALCQLIQLRDCYRQGWKPDFKNTKTKWCVVFEWDNLRIDPKGCNNNIFAFQDEKLAEKFLLNFKDLIEKTKPLFM